MKKIIEIVCQTLEISPESLSTRSRKKENVRARFFCWYFLHKKFPSATLELLGSLFERSHGTVIHGIDDVEHRIKCVPQERAVINLIWRKITDSPYIIKPNYEKIIERLVYDKPELFAKLGIDDFTMGSILHDLDVNEDLKTKIFSYVRSKQELPKQHLRRRTMPNVKKAKNRRRRRNQ